MTRGRSWSRPPCRAPDLDRSRRPRLEAPPPGYFTSLIIQVGGVRRGPTIPRSGRSAKDGPRVNHAPTSCPPGPPAASIEAAPEPMQSDPNEERADAVEISIVQEDEAPESGTRGVDDATGTDD